MLRCEHNSKHEIDQGGSTVKDEIVPRGHCQASGEHQKPAAIHHTSVLATLLSRLTAQSQNTRRVRGDHADTVVRWRDA